MGIWGDVFFLLLRTENEITTMVAYGIQENYLTTQNWLEIISRSEGKILRETTAFSSEQ